MTLSIEITGTSDVCLVEHKGVGNKSVLVLFAGPGDVKPVEGESGYRYFTRIPLEKQSSTLLPIPTESTREAIPVGETVGHEFEAYIVELKKASEGAVINGVPIKAPSRIDDNGVVFVAS